MSTPKRRWTRAGNRIGVWMYRTTRGRLSGGSKSVPVLMITSAGRRTGIPRSTCAAFLEVPTGLVVWGAGGGSARDPDWFENLRHAGTATVQIRDRTFQMHTRELVGTERDDIWRDVILAEASRVSKYADRAGRVIPVALLEPVVGPK